MKPKNPYEHSWMKKSWDEAYAAGLADGARRERRALNKYIYNNADIYGRLLVANLRSWLTARSRRGK